MSYNNNNNSILRDYVSGAAFSHRQVFVNKYVNDRNNIQINSLTAFN